MRRAALLASGVLVACAAAPRFPLRDPMTRDTDLVSRESACRREPSKKDPNHRACTPETYVSPLIWDGADNLVFRPIANAFAIDP
ncbi:MAG TPA: hypothetical protein VH054_03610, partial [Polyangiaceae bacterium]|nr:hypothetical protein [Polyangiaceae bacterium]